MSFFLNFWYKVGLKAVLLMGYWRYILHARIQICVSSQLAVLVYVI